MNYCPDCGVNSDNLFEFDLYSGDTWYLCRNCKCCFAQSQYIPISEFVKGLKDEGLYEEYGEELEEILKGL